MYSITLWKGDAVGFLSEYDMCHEVGKDCPSDIRERVNLICLDMQFISAMNRLFQRCPGRNIILRCSEGALMVPQMIKIVDAYERAVRTHQQALDA